MRVQGISRSFITPQGKVAALSDISAEMPVQGIVGLLGPNGSGKTTLLRIIMGILPSDAGEVWYNGKPLDALTRKTFGYMPEERGLYPKMTAKEQLLYLLRLRGLSKTAAEKEVAHWTERLEMPWIDRPARALSKGMQQKVQLVLALAGKPPVMLLDEPFSGLDPIVSHDIEKLLREKVEEGALIILSTHRLEQVDHLCDYILLIHRGRLILAGETNAIRRQFWQRTYEVEVDRPVEGLEWPAGVSLSSAGPNSARLSVPEHITSAALLQALLPQAEIRLFAEKLPTVREIFLHLVGEL
ncbi:MAG: ATP-binding cassette domain-containing protein [Bacteroidia bacterium]|nr:ATP-binding cassette domain-containing protein [Bacteroidia bacterium]MCX7651593.1 ATP-binding cassette domain-containing protein [Bacteroidia bacterium]MDW8417744.1 ATP-binding cassette domain-containing protein [Bacteroidia bacterium]